MNSLSPIRAPRSERRCNQPNARGAFSLSIRKSADGRGWWTGLDLNQRRENPADLQSAAIDRSATRPWGLASRGGVFGERSLACQRAWQQKAAHGSQTCFPTLPCRKSSSLLKSEARRVGKACVSTCRTRWSLHHEKK